MQLVGLLGIAAAFIIEEEEEFVFQDRAAQVGAELVANQIRPRNTIFVIKKSIGLGRRSAVELIGRAMKIICSGFRDNDSFRTASSTIGGSEAANLGAEFLDRFDRNCRLRLEGRSESVVRRINAIDGYIVLVRARAGYRAIAAAPRDRR